MWYVEHGIDEMDPKRSDCYTLVNVDSNGKELMRAGAFANKSTADAMLKYLNYLGVHDANIMAGYVNIDTFLRRYVDAQDKMKREEEERAIREAEEWAKQFDIDDKKW